MKKCIYTLVLIAFPGLAGLCHAQEAHEVGDRITTMEEVIVTATKTEEERKDIPNAVIVIDQEDIQESPAKTLGELLANELGLDWRTYGDYGGAREEIRIRGMDPTATQVRINGVSINSPSMGTADLRQIPLNSIERIEVVKGSGSLLYGSGAMGGTIWITTKRPKREKADFKARAGYGTQSTFQAWAEQGMFVTDDFGYYLTANRRQTHGFRSNSDLTRNDVTMKMVFDRGEALDVSLYADCLSRQFGLPGVKPPDGTQSYFIDGTEFFNSESASLLDRGADNNATGILRVKSRPTDWVSLYLRGSYLYSKNYNYFRSSFDGTGSRNWVTNKVFGAEGDVTIEPFKGASLLMGLQYDNYDWTNRDEDLDATGSEIPEGTTRTAAKINTTGTYLQAQYRPWKYVKGLVGMRHEDHSEFGTENLPRFGLILNPFESMAIKLNHGRHFLAPTPNDLFWPEGPYSKGNPDLKPETGWHTDATIEQDLFHNKLFVTLSYFYWNVNNKIQWAPDKDWIWTPQNLGMYKGQGVEVGTKIRPLHNLILSLNYTYVDAKEKNDGVSRRATYTPEHSFKGLLTYWTGFGLTATGILRYVGDRYFYGTDKTATEPTNILDSYWTTDVRMEQRLFDRWILSLQCNNLFDTKYDTYFGSFTDPTTWKTQVAGYPGAGRSVFFSLSYEY
jgi:outer membrane cobalamin receptor